MPEDSASRETPGGMRHSRVTGSHPGVIGIEPDAPPASAGARGRAWWRRPGRRLALIVAGSFLLWGGTASLSRSPWIFADELIYAELARSISSGSAPALRGVATHAFGLVYPVVIAPAWLVSSSETAYRLTHAINSLVLSLTALPAYSLARRFVSGQSALTVAAFSVLVPSMAYAGTVLTEVAFYPLFVLAVAALARALDTASARDQLLALGAIGLATATKVLAVALIGAGLLAIVLSALLARIHDGTAIRVSVRRFRTTLLAEAAVTLFLLALSIARGRSPYEWFGAYGEAVRHLRFGDVPLEFVQHLAALSLYTAVIPVAAAAVLVLVGFRRGAEARVRAFAVVVFSAIACTTAGVSVFAAYASHTDFATTGTPAASPLYERNVFVVCPLLLVALALWIECGLPRPRFATPVIAAAAALLMLVYPWALVPRAANPQNLAPVLLSVSPVSARMIAAIALAVASIAALVFLRARSDKAGLLWATVGTWFVLVGVVAVMVFSGASRYVVRTSAGVPFDWVDRAVGPDARVAVLWNERGGGAFARPTERQRVVWVAEFFNRSIRGVYVLGPRLPFGLPETGVRVLPGGQVADATGAPLRAALVLAKCRLGVRAPLVARDEKTQMGLYRVEGRVVLGESSPGCTSRAHR